MAVKYTTTTKVRDALGGRVASYVTDAMLTIWIEEAEAIIDTWLKVGDGTGSRSLTFSAAKKPHLVMELAATAMAASFAIPSSTISMVSMEQALLMAETQLYWWEQARFILTDGSSEDYGQFIAEQ